MSTSPERAAEVERWWVVFSSDVGWAGAIAGKPAPTGIAGSWHALFGPVVEWVCGAPAALMVVGLALSRASFAPTEVVVGWLALLVRVLLPGFAHGSDAVSCL
jgi:hypothetical protein